MLLISECFLVGEMKTDWNILGVCLDLDRYLFVFVFVFVVFVVTLEVLISLCLS